MNHLVKGSNSHSCNVTDYDLTKCGCFDTNCLGIGNCINSYTGSGYEADGITPLKAGTKTWDESDYLRTEDKLRTDVVAMGEKHTCSLKDGEVLCFGNNEHFQLGRGSSSNNQGVDKSTHKVPTPVKRLSKIIGLAAGRNHTCALEQVSLSPFQTKVHCWGDNRKRQAAGHISDSKVTLDAVEPLKANNKVITNAINVYANADFSCAILDKNLGEVKCWGDNSKGQLGYGKKTSYEAQPQTVIRDVDYGLDYVTVSTGDLTYRTTKLVSVKQLALGQNHACALVGESVLCWGDNSKKQLGRGDYDNEGNAIKNGANDYYATAAHVVKQNHKTANLINEETHPDDFHRNLLSVTQITAGLNHTCALLRNRTVICWGDNSKKQLGNTSSINGFTANYMRVGIKGRSRALTASSIKAGANHTCAVRDNGSIYCWGDNTVKQAGALSVQSLTKASPVSFSQTTAPHKLYAGFGTNCLASGNLACFGRNEEGQLGSPVPEGSTTYDHSADLVYVKGCSSTELDEFNSLASDWSEDFSAYTIDSWMAAGGEPVINQPSLDNSLVIDDGSSNKDSAHQKKMIFLEGSIHPECTVKASANFVVAYLVCRKFIVEARSEPLYIIGTIITTHLDIDPSAIKHGIIWTNIYNQQSVYAMRKYKLLRKATDPITYEALACEPHNRLHSSVSLSEATNCSSSIYANAFKQFTWTTMDPDCATLPGNQYPSCKRHYKRFLVSPHKSFEKHLSSLKLTNQGAP